MSYLEMQQTEIGQAQVIEALLRMKKLNLHENAIREFKTEGKLNKSEFGGILYWLDDEERLLVKNWEAETKNMVYHVIKNHTAIGMMYSFLYVSPSPEGWERDNDDLSEGCALAYVLNVDDPWLSEYGTIGIRPCIGGVRRIA